MILDEIVNKKIKDLKTLKAPKKSLYNVLGTEGISIIAEIKKASPSAGIISDELDLVSRIKQYEAGGAKAISVVTEKHFFQGSLAMLKEAKGVTSLPLLRKDFIFEPLQIYESLFAGADAILIIAALFHDGHTICDFVSLAHHLGMEALVEIHDDEELVKALESDARIIGFNNRDLTNMTVDIKRCFHLMGLFRKLEPDSRRKIIAESGVKTSDDVNLLEEMGFDGVLIGETLMRSSNPKETLKYFLGDEICL